ncbi:MAG: PaaI family thioesterase [Sphingomonadaceae bacterium]|nr:PaaI family thioesterase [Sphingomonadaceae bacterium]
MLSVAEINARIADAPFHRWMGMRAVAVFPSGVNLEIAARDEMLGSNRTGALHGGILGALIDATCSYAWIAQTGGYISTVDLRIDFHRPAETGLLRLEGMLVKNGRRIVIADARATDAEGKLLVSGRAAMMPA